MKTRIVCVLILLLPLKSFSQNCHLSYEQQDFINQEKRKIDNNSATTDDCIHYINVCSEVLGYCPDLYEEIIHTYDRLIQDPKNNDNPYILAYYAMAIEDCNKYVSVLSDKTKRKAFEQLSNKLYNEYKKKEDAMRATQAKMDDDKAFDWTRETPTIENCRIYLAAHPNGSHISEVNDMLTKLITSKNDEEDDQCYEYARQVNTEKAYSDYLIAFPKNGRHADKAKREIDIFEEEKQWPNASLSNDINILESFLNKFPYGRYALNAKSKLSELYLKKGDKELLLNDKKAAVDSYEKSLSYSYSNSLKEKVDSIKASLLYDKITEYTNIRDAKEDCDSYIRLYPNGEKIDEVKKITKKIDRKIKLNEWLEANKKDGFGFSVGYLQKQWVGTSGGQKIKRGFWDGSKYLQGIQAGIPVNFRLWRSIGMNAGVFGEYYASKSKPFEVLDESGGGGYGNGYAKMTEYAIYVPIHLEYLFRISNKVGVFLNGGIGLDCGVSARADWYLDGKSTPYNSENIYGNADFHNNKQFNVSAEWGGGIQIRWFRLNCNMSHGLMNQTLGEGVIKQNKMILSAALMF